MNRRAAHSPAWRPPASEPRCSPRAVATTAGSTATEPEESAETDGGTARGGGSGRGRSGPTSDVPVGGGTVFADEEVVVTQPTEGEFMAFTAVCTHQGCIVGKVEDDMILCPCHGSAVLRRGRQRDPRRPGHRAAGPPVEVTVEGDEIVLA